MLLTDLIFAVTIFFSSFVVAIFVLFKNYHNKKNRTFFALSFSISLWLLFSALANYSRNELTAIWFSKLAMVGAPLYFALLLYFTLIFPQYRKISKVKLFFIFFPAFAMELFVPTKYNIESVKIETWGTSYVPGYLFTALAIMIFVYTILIIIILSKKYKQSKGIIKEQIKYFLFSMISGITIGTVSNVLLPIVFNFTKASILGPSLAILCLNLILAYAIIRYRLLDIRVIIQEAFIYLITIFYLVLLYSGLVYVFKNLTLIEIESISMFASIISMLMTVFSLKYINNIIKNLTSPLLFKNKYNFSEVMSRLNNALNKNLELDKMLNESFSVLMESLQIEKITFLLYDEALGKFVSKKSLGFSSDVKLEINKNNPLYKYLDKIKLPLISEELEMKINDGLIGEGEKKIAEKTVGQFKEWSVYICQPIIKNKKIIGIVCVGDKISGYQFSDEDLKLIDSFASQVVLVIENFLVFSEVKAKKEQLEKNMNLMVGRELRMMELKNKIKELGGGGGGGVKA